MSTNTAEMISKPVTITEFIDLRRRLRDAQDVVTRASGLGLQVAEVQTYVTDLTRQPIDVLVPCIVCQRQFTVDMMLTDAGVPRTGVCGQCNYDTEAQVMHSLAASKLPTREVLAHEHAQGMSYKSMAAKYGVPIDVVFRKVKGDIGLN